MFEFQFLKNYHEYILGTDEVGRGPLAGPVVSAVVKVKNDENLSQTLEFLSVLGVTDSKKLSNKKRREIVESFIAVDELVPNSVLSFKDFELVIIEISPAEIDQINILQASLKSMREAVQTFKVKKSSLLLIDGNKNIPNLNSVFESFPIVKGDSKSVLIALASIFAKEYRDHLMAKLAKKYKGYGLESHAGYPTKSHLLAIKSLGVTKIHRKTFKGVKEYVEFIQ